MNLNDQACFYCKSFFSGEVGVEVSERVVGEKMCFTVFYV